MQSPLVQLIGFAGMAAVFWSFQQNKRSYILIWLVIGQLLFSIHYGFLGAWTAVFANAIAMSRGVAFYFKPNHRWMQSPLWCYGFIVVFCLGGAVSWEGYRTLLIVAASVTETIGLWRNSPKTIRWFLLGVRPLFFTYSILVGSYAGMVTDTLLTISLIIGMIRFDRKTK